MLHEVKVLDKVCKELGVSEINRANGKVYAITLYQGEVTIQGEYTSSIVQFITRMELDMSHEICDTGYIKFKFEVDGVAVKVVLT